MIISEPVFLSEFLKTPLGIIQYPLYAASMCVYVHVEIV